MLDGHSSGGRLNHWRTSAVAGGERERAIKVSLLKGRVRGGCPSPGAFDSDADAGAFHLGVQATAQAALVDLREAGRIGIAPPPIRRRRRPVGQLAGID